jgi:hypothetical protein
MNPAKERWSMWLVKKYLLSHPYWEKHTSKISPAPLNNVSSG